MKRNIMAALMCAIILSAGVPALSVDAAKYDAEGVHVEFNMDAQDKVRVFGKDGVELNKEENTRSESSDKTVKVSKKTSKKSVKKRPSSKKPAKKGDAKVDSEVKAVIDRINKERKKKKLPPMEMDATLNEMAEVRAKEITKKFSHTRPNKKSCDTVFEEFGKKKIYHCENIAEVGSGNVVSLWMQSKGHKANILDEHMEQVGVACAEKNGYEYWVMIGCSVPR